MNEKKHIEDILHYFEKYHYENMILDDNEAKFIHDYIINLQSKLNKSIEYIENHSRFEPPYYEMREFNNNANLNELYDILKEDK